MRENDYEAGEKFVLQGEEFEDGSVNDMGIGGPGGGWDVDRDAEGLVAAVEELEDAADGYCADLKVVEVPDGVEWVIDEYDGQETVKEAHVSWS